MPETLYLENECNLEPVYRAGENKVMVAHLSDGIPADQTAPRTGKVG